MTNNQMPVIGERYRNKLNSKDYFLASINTIFRECSNHILSFEFFLKIPSEEVDKGREAQNPYFRTSVVYDRFDYFWTDFEPIPKDPISQPSIPKEERLPEVGSRYRLDNGIEGEILSVFYKSTNGGSWNIIIEIDGEDHEFFDQAEYIGDDTYLVDTDEFWGYFETIPNNLQKPAEVQVKESILSEKGGDKLYSPLLSDEVREAMEDLKRHLPDPKTNYTAGYSDDDMTDNLKYLIIEEYVKKTLEEEKKSEEEKPKSIWKDEFENAKQWMAIPMPTSTYRTLQSVLNILENHEQRINKLGGK